MNFIHRTWAEIDLSALKNNFRVIKEASGGSKIMAVVKADAYGHSDKDIAPVLDTLGCDWFAVSNIEEALKLRKIGIKKPILILGYTPTEMAKVLYENDITQVVFSKEYAISLSKSAEDFEGKIKVHIKLDTGMGRIGFDCRDNSLSGIEDAIFSAKLPNFIFDGVFTHFANADRTPENEDGFTNEQYERFTKAIQKIKDSGLKINLCHCCNSAAHLMDKEKHLDMTRPGVILYGLPPADDLEIKENLIPVMTVKSIVSMVKTIKKGDTVNYGRTFKAEKEMKIATVSAGYADGYPRLLSNCGYVIIKGQRANIVGRICMDQFSVDVSHIDSVKMGDEVILFGKELPAHNLAKLCGTINYEIVCGISPRVPRIIIE